MAPINRKWNFCFNCSIECAMGGFSEVRRKTFFSSIVLNYDKKTTATCMYSLGNMVITKTNSAQKPSEHKINMMLFQQNLGHSMEKS